MPSPTCLTDAGSDHEEIDRFVTMTGWIMIRRLAASLIIVVTLGSGVAPVWAASRTVTLNVKIVVPDLPLYR